MERGRTRWTIRKFKKNSGYLLGKSDTKALLIRVTIFNIFFSSLQVKLNLHAMENGSKGLEVASIL